MPLAASASAHAQAIATITFRERRVDAVAGGVRGPFREVTVLLKGGARIEDHDRRTGRGRRRGRDQETVNESVFGGAFAPVAGRGAVSQWRVGRNNTLVRTTRHRNYTETITLSLVGSSSCAARVVYRRLGGVVFINRAGSFSDITAEDVNCRISEAGG